MSTFKVRDLMITVAPEGAEDCTALTGGCRFTGGCRGHSSPKIQVDELGSEELATLKQQLQLALAQVGERENVLNNQATTAGKSVETLELEALEPHLSAALDEVRARLAK